MSDAFSQSDTGHGDTDLTRESRVRSGFLNLTRTRGPIWHGNPVSDREKPIWHGDPFQSGKNGSDTGIPCQIGFSRSDTGFPCQIGKNASDTGFPCQMGPRQEALRGGPQHLSRSSPELSGALQEPSKRPPRGLQAAKTGPRAPQEAAGAIFGSMLGPCWSHFGAIVRLFGSSCWSHFAQI